MPKTPQRAENREKPGRRHLRTQLTQKENAAAKAPKKGDESENRPKKELGKEEEADATTEGQATQRKTGEKHGFPFLPPEGR